LLILKTTMARAMIQSANKIRVHMGSLKILMEQARYGIVLDAAQGELVTGIGG
jgi:hypothetical protein